MTMTRTLPTDKYGQVYYGPTTLAEAITATENLRDSLARTIGLQESARRVAQTLRLAGYTGVAARLLNYFESHD